MRPPRVAQCLWACLGFNNYDRSRLIFKRSTPRSIKVVCAPINCQLIVDWSRSKIINRNIKILIIDFHNLAMIQRESSFISFSSLTESQRGEEKDLSSTSTTTSASQSSSPSAPHRKTSPWCSTPEVSSLGYIVPPSISPLSALISPPRTPPSSTLLTPAVTKLAPSIPLHTATNNFRVSVTYAYGSYADGGLSSDVLHFGQYLLLKSRFNCVDSWRSVLCDR